MEGRWIAGEVKTNMYTKQEASRIRQQFWTNYGHYMRPIPGANGEPVNWINYKTGIKDLYFRMDANADQASISIELQQPDRELRKYYFDQFKTLKKILHRQLDEEWDWYESFQDENGLSICCIRKVQQPANVLLEKDWPGIISFFKPRMIALDKFWEDVRIQFES